MFYYSAIGNLTKNKYFFASRSEVDGVDNCFPISERTSDFCKIDKEDVHGVIHFLIDPRGDMKRAVPCKSHETLEKYYSGKVDITYAVLELTTYLGFGAESLIKTLS